MQPKSKEQIYKDYPNLEHMTYIELLIMEQDLLKYPEDKQMAEDVKGLINILSKEILTNEKN